MRLCNRKVSVVMHSQSPAQWLKSGLVYLGPGSEILFGQVPQLGVRPRNRKDETTVNEPKITVVIIQCIVKVHACRSNTYSVSELNHGVVLLCREHPAVQFGNNYNN